MAIDSIRGTSRIGSMADLWAQKIQANKEAKAGDPGVSVTPDGKIRVNNAGAMKVGQAQETESSDNDDQYTRQLKRVIEQMARVRASNASAEQKATQLQALNVQAMQIMGMIQQVMAEQAKANGGVSATA